MMTTSVQSSINNIRNQASQAAFETAQRNRGSDRLDKQAFMMLMIQQLRNQDPMNPTKNEEFVQQQATFVQMEEMQNLSQTMRETTNLSKAADLVGRDVDYYIISPKVLQVGNKTVTVESREEKAGVVNSVTYADGQLRLKVGQDEIPFENVLKLRYGMAPTPNSSTTQPTTQTGGTQPATT